MGSAVFNPSAASPGDLTATYIIQTADASLPNAKVMGLLATGVVLNTATTGAPLIATLTGLTLSAGALSNDLITGKAGGLTALLGTGTDNGRMSPNAGDNGQILFGTSGVSSPSYVYVRPSATGDDWWMFRSGKTSGGVRQPITVQNRGAAYGDDAQIGFEPAGGGGDNGGSTLSKTAIRGVRSATGADHFDMDFYVALVGGTANNVLHLDGVLGIARIQRGLQLSRVAKTGAYTMTDAETFCEADATGGAFDVTLPTAVGRDGQLFGVQRTSAANNVTVKSAGGTLNGVAAGTGIPLTAQYMVRWFMSNGTNWLAVMGLL